MAAANLLRVIAGRFNTIKIVVESSNPEVVRTSFSQRCVAGVDIPQRGSLNVIEGNGMKCAFIA